MSRIINHDSAGKERRQLVRLIGFAIRELNSQQNISAETSDLAAFIALSLLAVYETIDRSVEPWEKRGYWVKADRYRMEWAWTQQLGNQLRESLLNDEWAHVASITASIAEKLGDLKLPKRNPSGKFWIGSTKFLNNKRAVFPQ